MPLSGFCPRWVWFISSFVLCNHCTQTLYVHCWYRFMLISSSDCTMLLRIEQLIVAETYRIYISDRSCDHFVYTDYGWTTYKGKLEKRAVVSTCRPMLGECEFPWVRVRIWPQHQCMSRSCHGPYVYQLWCCLLKPFSF